VAEALTILAVALSLVLLWTRIARLEISSGLRAVLSVAELVGVALALISLRWLGLVIFVTINVCGLLVHAVWLAFQKDALLTHAATQCDVTGQEIRDLADTLDGNEYLQGMGPIDRARLVDYLSERARTPEEIGAMAPPIAALWTLERPPLDWLVERFDRILRLYGHSADDSMEVSDTLVRTNQVSAGTFIEIVDAMIAVVEPA
jgi:hypothetical protein